jgi:hypothetical protein
VAHFGQGVTSGKIFNDECGVAPSHSGPVVCCSASVAPTAAPCCSTDQQLTHVFAPRACHCRRPANPKHRSRWQRPQDDSLGRVLPRTGRHFHCDRFEHSVCHRDGHGDSKRGADQHHQRHQRLWHDLLTGQLHDWSQHGWHPKVKIHLRSAPHRCPFTDALQRNLEVHFKPHAACFRAPTHPPVVPRPHQQHTT